MRTILRKAGTFVISWTATFLQAAVVFASETTDGSVRTQINEVLNKTGGIAKIDTARSIGQVVGGVIQVALGLLGLIFLILLVYGGFKWMESKGDDKKVTEAQGLMFQAIIGIAITLSAFAITAFFTGALQDIAGFKK